MKLKTLNAISNVIWDELDRDETMLVDDGAEAVLVRSAAMHDDPLDEPLQAIARAGAGVNNIPIDRCSEKGIVVFNTPGANANAVAELVIAGLLLSSRNIAGGIEWAKGLAGQADAAKAVEKGKSQFVGPELRGKTLGVIGLGAIGALVANAANGLGMHVVGYDPYISIDRAWSLSRSIVHAKTQEEVIANADYLTFHIPLTDKTRGTVNEAMIASMKDGVRLLNFSRGELVDTAALKDALESGKVACYVTDFPNGDVLQLPHTVCIPHLGASTPESEDNCARMAAAQVRDYMAYGSIHNSVNLPEVPLTPPEGARVLVIHRNVPNVVSTISGAVSAEGINIENLSNRSKGDMAVTVMDMATMPSEAALAKIAANDAVIRVRTFG